MHLKEELLNQDGKIDPHKIDLVARLGGDWYTRSAKGLFIVPKPNKKIGIGFDQLPEVIRTSSILTGNDLGMLANVEQLPNATQMNDFIKDA